MDNKSSRVAHLASASPGAGTSHGVSQESKQSEREQRKLAFTRALVHGLARLIEGQRQFADEFGLALNRVFPSTYKSLEGQSATQMAISLFKSDWNSIKELEKLVDDLMMHQVALFSALDGIASTVLDHMGEEDLGDGKAKLNDARAWRLHKERVKEYMENDNLRFEQLVATGFVDNYVRTLEKHKYAKRKSAEKKLKKEAVHDYT